MDTNATFDPYTQSFTLLMSDGTPINASLPQIDGIILDIAQTCINYASQLGASVVMLALLALLTKTEKKKSLVFVLNVLSLCFNIIRLVLMCLYFTSPFVEIYAYVADDFSKVPTSAYTISITSTVITALLLLTVEASLLLQTHVVCLTLRKKYRYASLFVSVIMVLIAIGFRLVQLVYNSEETMATRYPGGWKSVPLWALNGSAITTSITVFWFCAVFVVQLGFGLYQRWKVGIRRFGPMNVLVIMGSQTLLIPMIFTILEYTTSLPSMDSNVLTLVALFLPTSTLWASAEIQNTVQPRATPAPVRNQIFTSNTVEVRSVWTTSSGGTTANGSMASPILKSDTDLEGQFITSPHDHV